MDNQYLAGFFDGEGCITTPRYKSTKSKNGDRLEIQITNCDLRPLYLIHKKYGGYLKKQEKSKKNPKWRDIYHWCIVQKKARIFLQDILPFLITKKRQVELALDFLNIGQKTNIMNIKGMSQRSKDIGIKHNIRITLEREKIREKIDECKKMVL